MNFLRRSHIVAVRWSLAKSMRAHLLRSLARGAAAAIHRILSLAEMWTTQ